MNKINKKLLRYEYLILLLSFFIFGCSNDKEPPPGFSYINPPDDVCTIAAAADTIWAGGKNGLFSIRIAQGKETAEKIKGLSDIAYVRALLLDNDETLWVGHILGLVTVKNGKLSADLTDKLPDQRVNCLYRDSKGRLWIGTWGGLTLFYDGKFTTYTEKDGLINNMVNVICEDSRGRLWIGSYVAPSGGITVLENGKFLRFSQKDGLPHSDITSIVKRGKCVWIGTGLYNSGGAILATIDDGKLKIVDRKDKQDGLAGEKVRTIFIDSHENTWFGSEYDGLVIFHKNGKKRMLTTENGLCNQEVKCIVEDRKGFFWIGTRNGITKIDRKHEQ